MLRKRWEDEGKFWIVNFSPSRAREYWKIVLHLNLICGLVDQRFFFFFFVFFLDFFQPTKRGRWCDRNVVFLGKPQGRISLSMLYKLGILLREVLGVFGNCFWKQFSIHLEKKHYYQPFMFYKSENNVISRTSF